MTVVNVTPPVVSGLAKQGQMLVTTNGEWTFDLDVLTYAYRWWRCDEDGLNCSQIGGAAGSSYVLAAPDVGHTIESQVIPTEIATPLPPSGTPIDDFGDLTAAFRPAYTQPVVSGGGPSGGGIFEETTGQGDGFKMIVNDQMPSTWNAATKNVLAQVRNGSTAQIGTTEDWYFKFMLPSAGNAGGVPNAWHAGVLWEFHTQSDSGHHLAIDGRLSDGGPRLHFARYRAPWTPGSSYTHTYDPAGTLQYDHWYECRMQIKWSAGSDGFLKFWLDGSQIENFSGATIKAGEQGYLQFGFYSLCQLTNEIHFAGITR